MFVVVSINGSMLDSLIQDYSKLPDGNGEVPKTK